MLAGKFKNFKFNYTYVATTVNCNTYFNFSCGCAVYIKVFSGQKILCTEFFRLQIIAFSINCDVQYYFKVIFIFLCYIFLGHTRIGLTVRSISSCTLIKPVQPSMEWVTVVSTVWLSDSLTLRSDYFRRAAGKCVGPTSVYSIYQNRLFAYLPMLTTPHYWQLFASQQTDLLLLPPLIGSLLKFRSGAITGAWYWILKNYGFSR